MEAVEAVLRYVTAGLVMEGCLTGMLMCSTFQSL